MNEMEPIRLRDALRYYIICLVVFLLIAALVSVAPALFPVAVIIYFICGWFMTRYVLFGLVEINILYDTLIHTLKIKAIHTAFWIIRYPILFIQLFFARVF